MKKIVILSIIFATSLLASIGGPIYGTDLIKNIPMYNEFGNVFRLGQYEYFRDIFMVVFIGVPAVFALHYIVIGPKIFSHDGRKIFVFSVFERFIHWLAGVGFILLIPTGFVMVFASTFGGGEFVIFCRNVHVVGTILFAVSLIPMFLLWVPRMFPIMADIKWMMIIGGYLSKKKVPIPASKYNAGQKAWFWVATLGGFVMLVSGAVIYFYNYDLGTTVGQTQINLVRIAAIVHNVMGMAVVALFFTHVYMAMFAIKGAIESMISGYKEEEEVQILHSLWYKELQEKDELKDRLKS